MNAIRRFWDEHPNISAFILLAFGMLAILYFSARHVGFSIDQWLVLGLATVVLAALCVWIIGWEGKDDLDAES